ncbi:MAG TPA: hypothetical protein VM510_08680, partial [Caulifigura sp.]|nr:hypothetical protein [Caulifigura sp.]
MTDVITRSLICWMALTGVLFAQSPGSAVPSPGSADKSGDNARFATERLFGKLREVGTLKSITRDNVELEVDGATNKVPLQELEQLRRQEPLEEPENPFLPVVTLQNGSVLGASSVKVSKRVAEVNTVFGTLAFPIAEIRWLRLAAVDEKMDAAWAEVTARDTKNDLLVVRKGDALDFVAGVIGDITDKEVKLLVRDREVGVPRERVFGVVYVQQPGPPTAMCE